MGHLYQPLRRLRDYYEKGGRKKNCKKLVRSAMKCCLPHMVEPTQSWTQCSYSYLHMTKSTRLVRVPAGSTSRVTKRGRGKREKASCSGTSLYPALRKHKQEVALWVWGQPCLHSGHNEMLPLKKKNDAHITDKAKGKQARVATGSLGRGLP